MVILLPGSQASAIPPQQYPIHARSGWLIPQPDPRSVNEQIPIMTPEKMRIHAQELTLWRRGLELRSISTHSYNCMGMIFAARRAWIETDHLYNLLREDGYRRIDFTQVMIGDVVVYKKNQQVTHVGLAVLVDHSIGTNIRILSKWGADPEFIHFMENVPDFFGSPEEYWTERV